MAHHNETKKLVNGASSALEEDCDNGEDAKLLVSNDGEKVNDSNKADVVKNVESSMKDSYQSGKSLTSPSTNSPVIDDSKKEEDTSKSVKFADDIEVYDLNSKTATPITVSLEVYNAESTPLDTNSKCNTSEDLAAVLHVVDADSSNQEMGSSVSCPSDLTLSSSSPSLNKDRPLSTAEKTQQEVEPTVHKHFDVSNVDEAELRRQIETENKDGDVDALKLDLENRPLLEKFPSAFTDSFSGQNAHKANQDTIGPLENPTFLKMLNYTVSQPAEDDAFGGASCLDLENFDSEPAPDMDGGWAWVVLFAAFFSLSLTGATMFTAGVLMSEIRDKIDNNQTKVSWIGAVHISITCMSGPFVGIILNRLGARLTAFLAGLILAAGLVSASQATSIIELIFTHGFVAGIGSGLILNTMFVIVGQYFNRYRGLACGVLATGSGAGMLAGGSILTALVDNFGLSGTYMLWGGITLHAVIFAMLLRPSPEERLRAAEKKVASHTMLVKAQDFQSDMNSMMSGLNSMYSGDQHSMFSGRTSSVRRIQKYPSKFSRPDVNVAPLLKAVLHRDMSRSTYSVATNRSGKSHIKSNLNIPASPTVAQSRLSFGPAVASDSLTTPYTPSPGTSPLAHSPLNSDPLSALDQADQINADKKLDKDNLNQGSLHPLIISSIPEKDVANTAALNPPSSPTNSRAPSEFSRSFRKRLLSGSSQTPSHYTSIGRLSHRPSIREQLHRHDLDNESLASTLVSHLQPQDALNPRYHLGSRSISSLMGSIASFPTALAIVKDDLSRIEATDSSEKMALEAYFISFLDSLRLLRNKPFLVFIFTCCLWALADAPFSLFLPDYVIKKGSTKMQAASLYTGMGFGSMCGRFLSGLVASDTGIGPILLHIGCLGIASFVAGFSPWITSTYIQQLVCAGLFGVYTGSLVPLSSLITIDLLGIGELGLGFGFLSMAQGIGYLAGPPLLGLSIQLIGYELSFVITGVIFLCASCLAMLIAILLRNTTDEEDLHDSFDDLERALRRISDAEEEGSDEEISQLDDDPHNKPVSTNSPPGASPRKKEEHTISADDASPQEGSGDHKEELKVAPLAEENLQLAAELETITEEA